jgi:hypothetical protein
MNSAIVYQIFRQCEESLYVQQLISNLVALTQWSTKGHAGEDVAELKVI